MTAPYATVADLEAWMPAGSVPGDADRLLRRASELLDDEVLARYSVDPDGLPTDPDVAGAMRDAACAQVEYWATVGEDHDIEGLAGTGVSVGHLRVDRLPPVLAPRARRILRAAGMLSSRDLDGIPPAVTEVL